MLSAARRRQLGSWETDLIGSRPWLASGSQFIPLRRNALLTTTCTTLEERLDAGVDGRRTGHALAALVVGLRVSLESPWRGPSRGRLDAWQMVEWGAAMSMPWRRVRAAADRLAAADQATTTSVPFVGSTITIERDLWVHDRRLHGDDDRHAMVSPAAMEALASEHDLNWREYGVLLALLLLVDTRDWQLKGWTLDQLGKRLGVGYRSLVAALDGLAERGLVQWAPRRGHSCYLTLPVGPTVIVPPRSETRPLLPRDQRRDLLRQASSARETGHGAAGELAGRLLAYHSLDIPPSPALLTSLAELLGRLDAGNAYHQLAAMGTLANSKTPIRDPIAVLVHRVRRLVDHRDEAAAAAAETRRRSQEAIRDQQEATRRPLDVNEAQVAEGRWVGQVLGDHALAEMIRLYRVKHPRPPLRAASAEMLPVITQAARDAVAAHPGLDAAIAVQEHTLAALCARLSSPDDSEAITAPLPLVRAGPTLAERIRPLDRR